jgi:hypothetical protein
MRGIDNLKKGVIMQDSFCESSMVSLELPNYICPIQINMDRVICLSLRSSGRGRDIDPESYLHVFILIVSALTRYTSESHFDLPAPRR